ncbi:MAG: hypothetical protein DRR06_16285 [Gammaproteobacteria bacterium]|nr:MAG: hypothetical protein DRR06_16285 [Gammaproteobacteria bacterium]
MVSKKGTLIFDPSTQEGLIRNRPKTPYMFTIVSRFNTENSKKSDPPDLLEIFHGLSNPAQDLFIDLKRHLNYQNNFASTPRKKGSTAYEQIKVSKARKELVRAGLIQRVTQKLKLSSSNELRGLVRKNTFMINPLLISTDPVNILEAIDFWKELTGRAKDSRKP